jgi:hypothetical protein
MAVAIASMPGSDDTSVGIGIGIGIPGGGIGMPGGRGGGRPRGERPDRGNVAAYKLYPVSAVYKLDGRESTAQLGNPDHHDVLRNS